MQLHPSSPALGVDQELPPRRTLLQPASLASRTDPRNAAPLGRFPHSPSPTPDVTSSPCSKAVGLLTPGIATTPTKTTNTDAGTHPGEIDDSTRLPESGQSSRSRLTQPERATARLLHHQTQPAPSTPSIPVQCTPGVFHAEDLHYSAGHCFRPSVHRHFRRCP